MNDFRKDKKLWTCDETINSNGGFAKRFNLPADTELVRYSIRYTHNGSDANIFTDVSFTVSQFRKLAFQVEALMLDQVYFLGDVPDVGIKATYLAGGIMSNAHYNIHGLASLLLLLTPGSQWIDYVFGPGNWESEQNLAHDQVTFVENGHVNLSVRAND